jgi:hypothetical protein
MFRKEKHKKARLFLQKRFAKWRVALSAGQQRSLQGLKVLVVGVYLADRVNFASHLVQRFSESSALQVTQRWASLCGISTDRSVAEVTAITSAQLVPKFKLMNQLLAMENVADYDFVIFTDDDVVVPQGFLELYISTQKRYNFALAQPARAWHSFYDHKMVVRKPWRQSFFCHLMRRVPWVTDMTSAGL